MTGDPGVCRSCGAPILWIRTTAGKPAPMNADGTSHFATCPQATKWRKRKSKADEVQPPESATNPGPVLTAYAEDYRRLMGDDT